MNKNIYRIIFNKRRSQLMVVSEHAAAEGKTARGERTATGSSRQAGVRNALTAVLKPLTLSVLAGLGMVMLTMGSANAQVVADPSAPGNQRPTVLQTTNGLPQINIQTPSAAGVSRNTYSQFDVQSNGAILNNSRTNTQTQLGGWVQGNPWLATGSARVIVNEVNSANPSQLRGYIEVAGQRAEVIIANPAGVNADGAGFINANRVTITTGTPQFNGGNLESFLVQRGTVTINGRGLDATLTDYTGILARAVQVNAGIWAKDLMVVTGANQISVDHTATATTTGSGAAPTFALDVAQLGGMYAGKITLIGTESGVGVRNVGVIGATAGDVVLQSDGWLTNSGSIRASAAGGNTQISIRGDISNSGTVYASGNSSVASRGSISVSGVVAAQNHTAVVANGAASSINATSSAVMAGGLNADGSLRTAGDLSLQATVLVANQGLSASGGNTRIAGGELNLSGANVSGANVALVATGGELNAANAQVTAQHVLSMQTSHTLRVDGAFVSADQIGVYAHDLSNVAGHITQSGATDLAIQLPGTLNNTQGHIASNSQNLAIGANTITNVDGQIQHAGTGTLSISAETISGQRGQITGNGQLNISAGSLDHRNASSIAQRVSIAVTNLDNSRGEITQLGGGQTNITAGQYLNNTAGSIQTIGAATISTATLDNNQGRITSAQDVVIAASSGLVNTDGTLAAGRNLTLSGGSVENAGGSLHAIAGSTALHVADLNNGTGSVYAGGDLSTTAANVTNAGSLYAVGNQTLNATGTVSNTGMVAAQRDTSVAANKLVSGTTSLIGAGIKADGSLATAGDLVITTTRELSASGQNLAVGGATFSGLSVNLSNSETSAANLGIAATSGDVVTSQGTVTTPGLLTINAQAQNTQTWTNVQGVVAARQLNAHVSNLNNTRGEIVQTGTGDAAINLTSATGTLDNTSGRIAVNSDNLALSAQMLTNTDGRIEHAGAGALTISAANLNGQRGQITSNGALVVSAGNIDHQSASSIAQHTSIAATNLDNRQGEITQLGAGSTNISTSLTLDNRGGTIASNGNTVVNAQTLNNQGGRLFASGTSNLNISATGALDNSLAGNIAAGGNAALVANTIINDEGQITAGGTLGATATQGVSNAQGLIAANGNASLTVATLNNTSGTVASVSGDLSTTTTGATTNDSGKLQAAGDVASVSGGFSNTRAPGQTAAGSITGRNVAIDTNGQALDNQFGTISATQSANLQTGAVSNQGGLVQAGTALTVNTHGQALTNASGGNLVSSGATTLNTGTFNNAGGLLLQPVRSAARLAPSPTRVEARSSASRALISLQSASTTSAVRFKPSAVLRSMPVEVLSTTATA